MKKFATAPLLLLLILSPLCLAQAASNLTLWYDQPAKDWNEALAVGNGRLGAMVYGRAGDELIQLNEQTLWTGGPVNHDPNPHAYNYLKPVRDALFADDPAGAVGLLKKMQGPDTQVYQPLGDLKLHQTLTGAVTNYRRQLDIGAAVATTRFDVDGVHYEREMFVSAPDQVIVLKLSASRAALNIDLSTAHELAFAATVEGGRELVQSGKARVGKPLQVDAKGIGYQDADHCQGMRYQWRTKIIANDGEVVAGAGSLSVRNASNVVLAISAATSFNGIDKCPDKNGKDEAVLARNTLAAVGTASYDQLRARHVADYQRYFNRVTLALDNASVPDAPIDERIKRYKAGAADPNLEALHFQFGRYLLISSSRPGGFPANLQGIWSASIHPAWSSNYTTNINLQMNYWPAEMTNLTEMVSPLIEHIGRMAGNGAYTAKNYYHMRGWAVHHNSDLWAQTNPVGNGSGDPKWANWALGSPWLAQHLYEHYRFTGDRTYLRNVAYPLMKGAAEFCVDWLVEKDGQLVTAPSTSPENVYLHPKGFKADVTVASAMDMEIIRDLFTNVIEAQRVLGIDSAFGRLLEKKRALLVPLKVGKKGNLVEWNGDWEDEDPQHRHVSHLFGLHPGREISPLLDPVYANAARTTLQVRGDGGTGWSKAWKVNFWARLLDGDHAYKMYQELLKNSTMNNLFDTHPPFQIDGNFGGTSGIGEMLLQSHLKEVQLLPALPSAWPSGKVSGLIARGAFEVAMDWKEGKLSSATLTSRAGNPVVLRTTEKIRVNGAKAKVTIQVADGKTYYLTAFKTKQGQRYDVQPN